MVHKQGKTIQLLDTSDHLNHLLCSGLFCPYSLMWFSGYTIHKQLFYSLHSAHFCRTGSASALT